MKDAPQEPLFITEEIEVAMINAGHVFEPPKHVSTMRLHEVPGFECPHHGDQHPGSTVSCRST